MLLKDLVNLVQKGGSEEDFFSSLLVKDVTPPFNGAKGAIGERQLNQWILDKNDEVGIHLNDVGVLPD